MNPMDLKRGIDMAVTEVVADLLKKAKKIKTSEEVAQVGTISANGEVKSVKSLLKPCSVLAMKALSLLKKPKLLKRT